MPSMTMERLRYVGNNCIMANKPWDKHISIHMWNTGIPILQVLLVFDTLIYAFMVLVHIIRNIIILCNEEYH